jgi:cell wall-associated NlpC family hydrolase
MRKLARLSALILLAASVGACAARGGVPRPFPGASVPAGNGPVAVDVPATPGETPEAVDGTTPAGTVAPPPPPGPGPAGEIVATALALRGVPYRNGGSDPEGFDCSGFVQYVFAQTGTSLPREVRDQFRVGRAIEPGEMRAGDLVFFETVSPGASHVGLVVGPDQFVHAPSSRGVVRVERVSSSYWARRFLGARRVDALRPADVD